MPTPPPVSSSSSSAGSSSPLLPRSSPTPPPPVPSLGPDGPGTLSLGPLSGSYPGGGAGADLLDLLSSSTLDPEDWMRLTEDPQLPSDDGYPLLGSSPDEEREDEDGIFYSAETQNSGNSQPPPPHGPLLQQESLYVDAASHQGSHEEDYGSGSFGSEGLFSSLESIQASPEFSTDSEMIRSMLSAMKQGGLMVGRGLLSVGSAVSAAAGVAVGSAVRRLSATPEPQPSPAAQPSSAPPSSAPSPSAPPPPIIDGRIIIYSGLTLPQHEEPPTCCSGHSCGPAALSVPRLASSSQGELEEVLYLLNKDDSHAALVRDQVQNLLVHGTHSPGSGGEGDLLVMLVRSGDIVFEQNDPPKVDLTKSIENIKARRDALKKFQSKQSKVQMFIRTFVHWCIAEMLAAAGAAALEASTTTATPATNTTTAAPPTEGLHRLTIPALLVVAPLLVSGGITVAQAMMDCFSNRRDQNPLDATEGPTMWFTALTGSNLQGVSQYANLMRQVPDGIVQYGKDIWSCISCGRRESPSPGGGLATATLLPFQNRPGGSIRYQHRPVGGGIGPSDPAGTEASSTPVTPPTHESGEDGAMSLIGRGLWQVSRGVGRGLGSGLAAAGRGVAGMIWPSNQGNEENRTEDV